MQEYKVRNYARQMRNNPTLTEKKFWERVKKRKLLGLRFNRQHYFSYTNEHHEKHFYIVDFYCHELKLLIEIDGCYHNNPNQIELDSLRTEILDVMGFYLIRFTNEDVLQNMDKVTQELQIFIKKIDDKQV